MVSNHQCHIANNYIIMNDEVAIYFGQKGYTIYKENLEITEQELIRKELTVSPYVPKNSFQKPSSFPIYRESPKKMYLPKYYGSGLRLC